MTEPAVTETQDKQPAPDAQPAPDKPPEQTEQEKALAAQLEQLQENYSNVRSHADNQARINSEREKELAELKGMVTALTATKQTNTAEDEQALYEQWANEIDEKPGETTVKLMKTVGGEMRNDAINAAKKAAQEELAKIQETIAGLTAAASDQNPDYLSNKETVDKLEKAGLDRESALKAAKAMNENNGVTHPSASPAPGTLPSGGTKPAPEAEVPTFKMRGAPLEAARMAGLSDEDIAKMEKEIAEERAKS